MAETLTAAATEPAEADLNTIQQAAEQQWLTAWQHAIKGEGGGGGSNGCSSSSGDGNSTGSGSQRLAYGQIKTAFECEPYLQQPGLGHRQRCVLARLRTGANWLAQHTARYARRTENTKRKKAPCCHCQDPTSPHDNPIFFCDHCDAPWHWLCHYPSPHAPPPFPAEHVDWFCRTCTSNQTTNPDARLQVEATLARALRCPHCSAPCEDLSHFLFDCPRYEHLRRRYPDLFAQASRSPAAFLSSTDCLQLAEYTYSCYQIYKSLSANPNT